MSNQFIAGIDGGGTKTECLVTTASGKVIGRGVSGPSNPRNQGVSLSADNVISSLKKAGKVKLSALVVALPAVEEECEREGKEIIKRVVESGLVSKKRVYLKSDQEIAFRAGSDEDGVLVIAGTGSVVRGWKGKREMKVGGWGYLADEGSAFWIGHRAYQAITKSLDERRERTLISELSGFSSIEEMNRKIYKNFLEMIPKLSIAVDLAADKGDKIAISILKDGAKELISGVEVVSKKLGFKREFPLVLSGGIFKSPIFISFFEKEIKKRVPFAKFTPLKQSPVFGALKLAKEIIDEEA